MRELAIAFVLLAVSRAPAAELIWNAADGIYYQSTAKGGAELIYTTYETRGLATDQAALRLFWTDVLPLGAPFPGGVVRSAPVAGGQITDLVTRRVAPAGVAVDSRRETVYWTEVGDEHQPAAILAANLDGSQSRTLISEPWLSEIAGVAVDSANAHLYFTYVNPLIDSIYAGGIGRADLDGRNVETVVSGLGKPVGIAIDSSARYLYWTDWGLGAADDGSINAARFDGQQHRTLVAGLGQPYGVALELSEQSVYWSDMASGKIQRTAMSGVLPFFEDVVIGLRSPTGLVIVAEPTGWLPTLLLLATLGWARPRRNICGR